MINILRSISCACLLWSTAFSATAGSFTPASGTTISSTSVTVGWTSTASQQWVRAYNGSEVKIFDSGRKTASTGSVQFSLAATDTSLRVVFYEKSSNGQWHSSERTYSVNAGSSGVGTTAGGGTSQDTLANLTCSIGQLAKFNGSDWACADDNDTNTDILSNLKCASGQMAVTGNDGEWICSDPKVTDAEDIISAIEAMICGEGEELTRNDTGELVCFNDALACPYTQQIEEFYNTHRNSAIFTSNYNYRSTYITDNEDVCSVVDEYIISGLPELIYTSITVGDYSMYGLGIDTVEDGVLSLIFNEDFNLLDPEYSVEHFSTTDEAVACAVFLGCEHFGQQEN